MFIFLSLFLGLAILAAVTAAGRGMWWVFFRAVPWLVKEEPGTLVFIIIFGCIICLGMEALGEKILRAVVH